MIQVNNLSKQFGPQILFEDISFILGTKEKVGVVGRNGSGKSTLFRLIQGLEIPDAGEIVIPKNYCIGALEQHIKFTRPTVLAECCQFLKGDEQYDFYKAEKILSGLGFSSIDMQKPPEIFSGGYQLRINLAKVLVQNPDLLLLDEPTNYLDIVSLRWLSSFLRSFQGEVLIITHDREFMDQVTTHTMGITRQKLRKMPGSTIKYYEELSSIELIHEKTRLNQEKKVQHLESFVERFRAKASKATQAQSRLKMLEKENVLEKLVHEKNLAFSFNYKECPGKTIMSTRELDFTYDKSQYPFLIKDLSFEMGRNDRVAIIGKNGKGKSTLLNLLGNELSPLGGTIKVHPNAVLGHFGQMNIGRLNEDFTVIDEITSANNELSIGNVRRVCGQMMFEGDLAKKKVKVLSGGERSRVLLGKILANSSNLLLLDEPTNHLDIEAIESLSQAIENYPGAVIIVTHSEMLLKRLATKLIVFHRGKVELFDGTYNEFLEKIGWEEEIAVPTGGPSTTRLSKKELKSRRADLIAEKSKVINPLKKQVAHLEDQIMKMEDSLNSKNDELITASHQGDGTLINVLSKEVKDLEIQIESFFEQLDSTVEELEVNEKKFNESLELLQ
ncbi:MAG: ABC-F family ATP-binding cassette domain-containing protein [Bacteriovoracaceae bacterium]|nr:ABC-F family ATP-binding cassette domain-containing protein [Bacteriovoracaceae bacterium]